MAQWSLTRGRHLTVAADDACSTDTVVVSPVVEAGSGILTGATGTRNLLDKHGIARNRLE